MKVELLKDVLISNSEVGTTGKVYDLTDSQAKAMIKRGLAQEAGEDAIAEDASAPVAPKKRSTKPATTVIETKPDVNITDTETN